MSEKTVDYTMTPDASTVMLDYLRDVREAANDHDEQLRRSGARQVEIVASCRLQTLDYMILALEESAEAVIRAEAEAARARRMLLFAQLAVIVLAMLLVGVIG
jgi:hypothetical protein